MAIIVEPPIERREYVGTITHEMCELLKRIKHNCGRADAVRVLRLQHTKMGIDEAMRFINELPDPE